MTIQTADVLPRTDTVPRQRSALNLVTQVMRNQPWWLALMPPTLLTLLMGWLDDVTGWEVSLFIFYAVPIVMAGGKKLPELEALTMAYNAVQQGAAGVDMGRNIFQSDAPKAMMAAVNKVVHENMKPAEALQLFESLKAETK